MVGTINKRLDSDAQWRNSKNTGQQTHSATA